MIKLADSPDVGWKVAQEYQSNLINSEDEKLMNRALSKEKPVTVSVDIISSNIISIDR